MFELIKVKYKDIININYLKLEKYKVTALIGASGSGKTTILKMLNKLITPSTGQINYQGTDLSKLDSINHRRKVSMLSQNPTIFKGTIKENLNMGLYFQDKENESDNKLKEVLDIVKLDKDLETDATSLSGGEKQRLALARIILINPDVYLLDEPSSALDDETEDLLIKSIIYYAKKNKKTVIMVTHSKNIAKKYSDIIIEIGDISSKENDYE